MMLNVTYRYGSEVMKTFNCCMIGNTEFQYRPNRYHKIEVMLLRKTTKLELAGE